MKCVLAFVPVLMITQLGLAQLTDPTPQRKTVDELIRLVQSSDSTTQVAAIEELATRGAKAAKAVPALVNTFAQDNEEVRLNAMLALGEIGKAAVPALKKQFTAGDENIRLYAVWGIGLIGEEAKEASQDVVRLLADKNDDVRRKAAYALGRINPDPKAAVSVLTEALKDKNQDVRQAATTSLTTFGAKAVPGLVGALEAQDNTTRQMALTAIGEIGHDAEKALPAVYKLFTDSKLGLQYQAAQTMGKIGKPAVEYFNKALEHENSNIRQAALQGLRVVGGPGVPALVDALGSKHDEVRQMAAQQLGYMRVSDRLVVIALGYALKDKNPNVRVAAAYALQSLGAGATLAKPYLQKALLEGDKNLQRACFSALMNLKANPADTLIQTLETGTDEQRYRIAHLIVEMRYYSQLRNVFPKAAPILVDALKSKDKTIRYQSATALLQIRQSLKEAGSILVALAQDKKFSQRASAIQALGQVGTRVEGVWPVWLNAVKEDDTRIKQAAIYGMRTYRFDKDKALSTIATLLDDEKAGIRQAAVQSLNSFGSKAIPYYQQAIEDDDEMVRVRAAQILVQYPNERKKVLPHLEKLLESENSSIRQQAFYAIQRTGKDASGIVKNLLQHKDATLRSQAVWVLWNWDRNSDEPLKAIAPLMDDSDSNVRQSVRNVMSNARQKGVPYMLEALKASRSDTRLWATQMLAYYGSRSGEKVPQAIAKALASEKAKNVRTMGFWSLQQLQASSELSLPVLKAEKDATTRANMISHLYNRGKFSAPFVPYLIQALKDDSSVVRNRAATALGTLGTYATEALSALEQVKQDSDAGVRQAASQAIVLIQRAIESNKK